MEVTSARLSENSDVEYCSSCTETIQSINSPKHIIVHHSSWDLTLPWYLILSCCCCRKPGPPVLLLLYMTESFNLTSHPRFFSTPSPQSPFSLSFSCSFFRFNFHGLPAPCLALLWGRSWHTQVKTPTASPPPCLHLQVLFLLTGQVNVRLSFPLNCWNSSYTSDMGANKRAKESKLLANARKKEKWRAQRVWKNLLRAPLCKHVITVELYKKGGKYLKSHDEISVHSFFPSLPV